MEMETKPVFIEFAVLFWTEEWSQKCPTCKGDIKYHDWYVEEWNDDRESGEGSDDYCIKCGLELIKKSSEEQTFESRPHIISEKVEKVQKAAKEAMEKILEKGRTLEGSLANSVGGISDEERPLVLLMALMNNKSSPERLSKLFEATKNMKIDVETLGEEFEKAFSQE